MSLAKNKRKKNTPGYVYLIKSGEYCKIGLTTTHPFERIKTLQIGNPEELVLITWFKTGNPFEDEQRLHRVLQDYHIRGEWFKLPVNLINTKNWFENATALSDRQLVKEIENCLGGRLSGKTKAKGLAYEKWCEFCLGKNGVSFFSSYLDSEHPYAIAFLEDNTEWIIEQLTKNGDYKRLVLVYGLLFDREFLLSDKKYSLNIKQKLCYQMFVCYQSGNFKCWKDILEFAVDWIA